MSGFRNDFGKWFPTSRDAIKWMGSRVGLTPAQVDGIRADLEAGEPVTIGDFSLYPDA